MDGDYRAYDFEASRRRIDEILGQPSGQFEEVDSLPDRDRLTFTNGFYAQFCTALFVDLRDSTNLPNAYTRPRLAKIYRAFISEMVAIFNSARQIREVNIVGDCVWAVYSSRLKADNDDIFAAAFQANSLMDVLNIKLKKMSFATPIRAGIGIADGRALMIKVGYSGSGINDVVYMGEVVNKAARLAGKASQTAWTAPIFANESFYASLNEHNQTLLKRDYSADCYTGTVISLEMDEGCRRNDRDGI